MKASVIIPTLNESGLLPKLLDRLDRQTFRDFEIIVADAGSTDGTREICRSRGVTLVDGGMPAVGRNRVRPSHAASASSSSTPMSCRRMIFWRRPSRRWMPKAFGSPPVGSSRTRTIRSTSCSSSWPTISSSSV
jgi:glycosyltransferase involved in cell wall biosynthesis